MFLQTKASMESLDRGETPERVEFENLDLEEDLAHSEMDEDEWTDRNFGASANEMLSSDELSEFRLVNLIFSINLKCIIIKFICFG